MPRQPLATDSDPLAPRPAHERLRFNAAVRGALIAYGTGAYMLFAPQLPAPVETPAAGAGAGSIKMLLAGVGLQVLVLVARRLLARYDRWYLVELVADGITVLLFALATYGGIARYASAL